MKCKRCKDQIIAEILAICCGNGASKTKVVYASGLNFKTIRPYLAILIKNELLEVVEGFPTLYKTTKKGCKVLEYFTEIEKLMPDAAE
jgi:predicted transcriptional regulator